MQRAVALVDTEFKELYQVCVRDIISKQPGFGATLSAALMLTGSASVEIEMGTDKPARSKSTKTLETPESTEQLMEQAARIQPMVNRYAKVLAEATGGLAPLARIKGVFRVLEKQLWESFLTGLPQGSTSFVWDAARSMVIDDVMRNICRAVEQFQSDHRNRVADVTRVKYCFSSPVGGWSDIMINLRCFHAHGQLFSLEFEIQLVHKSMIILRHDPGGHDSYAKYRFAKELLEHEQYFTKQAVAEEGAVALWYGNASKDVSQIKI